MINLDNFDPNGCSFANGNFIGLPFDEKAAQIVFLPVPWEVTVSYSAGCARAADNILNASYQLDLYDADVKDAWKIGIFLRPLSKKILAKSDKYRQLACQHIEQVEQKLKPKKSTLAAVNKACTQLQDWVEKHSAEILDSGKIVGLIGGDHSTPLGLLRALGKKHKKEHFGVLHIDAHCDLRDAYEGFTYSHASIFRNALESVPNISKLVQVGIRDYCQEELDYAKSQGERVKIYFDQNIKEAQYQGKNFHKICLDIVAQLPQLVYISFDIDGLDPKLCPNTGTPVAGGFELQQMYYLVKLVALSGRQIIGFDLVETGIGSEWDGNVAARMLYKMANLAAFSQGLASMA